MEIKAGKKKIVAFVEDVYEGRLCLPTFQRDFVWKRAEVADLLRSILKRYYIGQILLLPCDPKKPPFAPTALRPVADKHLEPQPTSLILDGQQRLTSLLYALHTPEEFGKNATLKDSSQHRWFFVNLALFLSEPDNDSVVFDRTKKELNGLDTREVQFEQMVIPCADLRQVTTSITWLSDLEKWIETNKPEEISAFRENLKTSLQQLFFDFASFEVPYNELVREDKESEGEFMGQVCAIFEKLNSTGIDLSLYDLLTARLYRSKIDLHALWNATCKGGTDNSGKEYSPCERIQKWTKGDADKDRFGVLMLRTLALLRDLDPKPRLLIDLSPDNFETDWRRAAQGLEKALQLVTLVNDDGFGAFDRKWLPGTALLPVLAALRREIKEHGLGEKERAELRRWYWCNVFLERYSSSVESKSRKDYIEMMAHWTQNGSEPSVFVEARARIGGSGYTVRDSTSSSSSVYSGVFCLLAIHKARDWMQGESIELQELQDHHIFPQNYLKKHGIKDKITVNSILNRTLISAKTNGKIRDKAPSTYLQSSEIFPSGATPTLMDAHFINTAALADMQCATDAPTLSDAVVRTAYEDFLKEREAAIVAEIRARCGV